MSEITHFVVRVLCFVSLIVLEFIADRVKKGFNLSLRYICGIDYQQK